MGSYTIVASNTDSLQVRLFYTKLEKPTYVWANSWSGYPEWQKSIVTGAVTLTKIETETRLTHERIINGNIHRFSQAVSGSRNLNQTIYTSRFHSAAQYAISDQGLMTAIILKFVVEEHVTYKVDNLQNTYLEF